MVVGLISLVFGFMVTGQYRKRHKLHQLVWSIALYMSAIGSFSYGLSIISQSPLYFHLYYIFGGLLMAAWLGLGSITLVFPQSVGKSLTWVIAVISVIGAGMYATTPSGI